MSEEISVISSTYEIYKKLIELSTLIDKKYRFSICETSVQTCTDLLEQLILAKHAPKTHKAAYLISADAKAELLALQVRVVLEMKLVNETNVLKLQAKLTEARRQIGGWRRSVS
jgi:hypothetical protein